jgi:hypothetical protein
VTGVSLFLKLSLLSNLTIHDLRARFRNWAAACTNLGRPLSRSWRIIGDKVEAAYRRDELFEKRRRLMDAWARCQWTAVPDVVMNPVKRAKAE